MVHPEIRAFIDAYEAAGLPRVQDLTPAAAREQMDTLSRARNTDPTPVAKIEEIQATGPHGTIPVRLYRAKDASSPQPVLVYFHGGGHVIGSLDSHDAVARNLCAGAECAVASVDYRMGPENKFPASYDDSLAATKWVAEHAATLGIDPARIAVGGDSAGGNLAAVVALGARDTNGPALCFQLLVYPVADYRCASPSYKTYAKGFGVLEAETMYWFQRHYLNDVSDASDWRASPLLASDLTRLPPALVITAQCDVLHDEGVALAKALRDAGGEAEHLEGSGMIHGFFGLAPMIAGAVSAQAHATGALRRAFGG